jgi:outer membrane protein assembly factor BamB
MADVAALAARTEVPNLTRPAPALSTRLDMIARKAVVMRRNKATLLGVVGAIGLVLATAALAQQPAGKVWTQEEMFRRNVGTTVDQVTQFPPHKIIGNVYYVGTRSLASFLVTTPQGHVLINTNYEAGVPVLKDSVEKLGFTFTEAGPRAGIDWPAFRGIDASGVAEGRPTPARFAPAAAAWKTPIAGLGHSSPVVWGDQLCVTTAISGRKDAGLRIGPYGDVASVNDDTVHEWKVICLDKRTGTIRWEQSVHKGVPAIKRHTKATHANSTLATDGAHLAAMFGSEGLHVYDLNGKLLWNKKFGVLDSGWYTAPEAQWEFGSSPIIHDGMVIIQADVQNNSFLAAFDVKTGREIWRIPRADVPTWGTPAIVNVNGRKQVVVNGWKHIGGYDLLTGREIWKLTGGGDIPVPTPVFGHGLIFITSAHGDQSPVYAIRATATGDISLKPDETSNAHVVWSVPRAGAYMATPLLYGDHLYVVRWNGIMAVFEARTGTRMYQQRLGGGTSAFTASPVASGGHVYVTSEDGDVFVVKAGPTYELIATNQIDAPCLATPAISEGRLFFRTKDHILAFGN